MMHLAAFSGAKTDSTANEALPAPADGALTRTANANQYLSPADVVVLWALARNDTITRARLSYPSTRDLGLPEIFPLDAQAEPAALFRIAPWGMNGPRIKRTEEFGVDVSNGASTVDNATALVCLSDGMLPAPGGRRVTVRGTSAQTLVANAWTLGGITLDQTLPFGRYAVIGMQCTCNDAHAARLLFPQNASWRPGVPTGETIALGMYADPFRAGAYGEWGRFDQTAPPQLEVLGGTAGAETAAVILDLVQL